MLTLYMSPGSSSMATHIMLHEIGVDFESRWLSFAKREQHAPEYLALNPDGKVPTLVVDGHPLTEVAATLYYLAKRYPAAGLFPAGDLDAEVPNHFMDVVHRLDRPSGATGRSRAVERGV